MTRHDQINPSAQGANAVAGKASPMHSFDPAADSRAFRNALGAYATGVTVITCVTPDGPVGITANSFASLSLDPPLILWSPAKSSTRYDAFMAAERFAVHVLADDQADVATAFAKAGDAFDRIDWEPDAQGVPRLSACLARFDCATETTFDGGDHTIIVGRVSAGATGAGSPLVFQGGGYGGFRPAD